MCVLIKHGQTGDHKKMKNSQIYILLAHLYALTMWFQDSLTKSFGLGLMALVLLIFSLMCFKKEFDLERLERKLEKVKFEMIINTLLINKDLKKTKRRIKK